MQSDQKGVAMAPLLLLVAVLATLAIGLYVFKDKNKQTEGGATPPAATVTPQPAAPEPAAPAPVAINKEDSLTEYCAPHEKACFKYPKTWKLEDTGAPDPNEDGVRVTSPLGTTVTYVSAIDGIGGSCGDDNPNINVDSVEATNDGLFVLTASVPNTNPKQEQIGLMDAVGFGGQPVTGPTGKCPYYIIFASKRDSTHRSWFKASIDVAEADRDDVMAMMKSFHY